MEDPEKRKGKMIFRLLSKEIATRTGKQIKTHHQKMIIKHKNIEGIINAWSKKSQKPRRSICKSIEDQ